MRSTFTDKPQDIVPRTLRDLIAADDAQAGDEKRRRRQRRAMTVRRFT
ncbi:hypothetical protein [Actinomadura fibrosa]|uniref:Transposase n=1 Tax=Actinomadura fibrosa TaxID=111802 RepID=A0ABW2XCU0_9ACTN|nr:hypothetical protein [Actinomadura fibrosa]